MELLEPSERVTSCPYKGNANYYSLTTATEVRPNLVWYYKHPTMESSKIAGMLAFYNERVDAIYVDGDELSKPKARWSAK